MNGFGFVRTRAFWKMVLEFLVIPLVIGCILAGLVVLAIYEIAGLTS